MATLGSFMTVTKTASNGGTPSGPGLTRPPARSAKRRQTSLSNVLAWDRVILAVPGGGSALRASMMSLVKA